MYNPPARWHTCEFRKLKVARASTGVSAERTRTCTWTLEPNSETTTKHTEVLMLRKEETEQNWRNERTSNSFWQHRVCCSKSATQRNVQPPRTTPSTAPRPLARLTTLLLLHPATLVCLSAHLHWRPSCFYNLLAAVGHFRRTS